MNILPLFTNVYSSLFLLVLKTDKDVSFKINSITEPIGY